MTKRPILFLRSLLVVSLVLLSGVLLSACGKEESEDTTVDTDQTEETEETEEDTDVTDSDSEDEESEEVEDLTGFDDFSAETQTVGSSAGKEDSEYRLESILDTEMPGYHRFEFTLSSSDEDELPMIEAKLVSSGGYVQITLDRVTYDAAGIAYQSSRDISTDGILRLYHQVTANPSEEVYQIGVTEDTIFYLHVGSDLKVILDVKYPGEADESVSTEDEMDYTDANVTLEDTNTEGDVKLGSYSWGVEGSALRFVWGTSSASGNPTPGTEVVYDKTDDTLTVTLTKVSSDSVIGSDNTFAADLISPVSHVSGTRSGTTSTYVFELTKDTSYRIYRSVSPNQLVLDIMR